VRRKRKLDVATKALLLVVFDVFVVVVHDDKNVVESFIILATVGNKMSY
jgi:hypothetical protein